MDAPEAKEPAMAPSSHMKNSATASFSARPLVSVKARTDQSASPVAM